MSDAVPGRDPIAEFQQLFARASTREPDATAVALATADATGAPSVRMVLLKAVDEAGFVFFTNYESRKATELDVNPRAALCFYWPTIGVQVRVEGGVERVTAAESEAYFATRPRESQLGAWASRQSRPLASAEALREEFARTSARFAGRARPPSARLGRLPHAPAADRVLARGRAPPARPHPLHARRRGWTVERLFP